MQQNNKYVFIKYVYRMLICYNIFRSLLLLTPGRRTRIQTIYKQLHKSLIKTILSNNVNHPNGLNPLLHSFPKR